MSGKNATFCVECGKATESEKLDLCADCWYNAHVGKKENTEEEGGEGGES